MNGRFEIKGRNISVLVFILTVVLPVIMLGCGQKEESIENTAQEAYGADTVKEVAGLSLQIEPGDEFIYESDSETLCYFYSVMNEKERKLYRIFQDIMDHFNEDDHICRLIIPADLYDEAGFKDYYIKVYTAFYRDHPEYYPIAIDSINKEIIGTDVQFDSEKNEYVIYVAQVIRYPAYAEEIEKMEKGAEDFFTGIDLNQDDEDVALEIHDKLLDSVYYEDRYAKDMDTYYVDYSRCAYGALVDDADGGRYVVCSGVSAAYQYLLTKAGIKCTTITGYVSALNHDKTEFKGDYHIWNAIYINGEWYEVDATMDAMGPCDVEIGLEEFQEIQANADENTKFEYSHLFFCITAEEMSFKEMEFSYSFQNGTTKDLYMGYRHYRTEELEENGIEMKNTQRWESLLNDYLPD